MLLIVLLTMLIVWTLGNLFFLPRLKTARSKNEYPRISILIPMRNEAHNVSNCIGMLKQLAYKNIEFIIYDDLSTDDTYNLLQKYIGKDKRFRVVGGKQLKEGWVGKVHACYQLRKYATGEYLCFIDADVTLSPNALRHSLASANRYKAALVTGFPRFIFTNWLDRLVIPMMHFVVYLHLPIAVANYTRLAAATAANGTFMFFHASSYDQAGGHEAVKDSLVEDVHLAQKMKQCGYRVLLANITEDVWCRMYETSKATWEGFSKNIFVGIGRSYFLATGLTIFYCSFYLLPFACLFYGLFSGQFLYMLPYALTVLHRAICDWRSKTPLYYSFTVPASSLMMLVILWRSIYLSNRDRGYVWKGRYYP